MCMGEIGNFVFAVVVVVVVCIFGVNLSLSEAVVVVWGEHKEHTWSQQHQQWTLSVRRRSDVTTIFRGIAHVVLVYRSTLCSIWYTHRTRISFCGAFIPTLDETAEIVYVFVLVFSCVRFVHAFLASFCQKPLRSFIHRDTRSLH